MREDGNWVRPRSPSSMGLISLRDQVVGPIIHREVLARTIDNFCTCWDTIIGKAAFTRRIGEDRDDRVVCSNRPDRKFESLPFGYDLHRRMSLDYLQVAGRAPVRSMPELLDGAYTHSGLEIESCSVHACLKATAL